MEPREPEHRSGPAGHDGEGNGARRDPAAGPGTPRGLARRRGASPAPIGLGRVPLRRRIPVIALLVIFAGLIGWQVTRLALDTGGQTAETVELQGRQDVAQLYRGVPQDGAALGSPAAPVELVVFNDVQCEPCARWHLRTVPALVRRDVRREEVRMQLRHFSTGARELTLGALGAAAAGLQDGEWQFTDLLIRNQGALGGRIDEDLLRNIARAVDLDVRAWQSDLDSAEVERRLDRDAGQALELRLPAEPAVIATGPGGTETLIQSPSLREIEDAVAEVR